MFQRFLSFDGDICGHRDVSLHFSLPFESRGGGIISVTLLPRSLRSLALSASRTVFKSDPRNQRAGPAAQDRPFDGRGGGIRTHETLRPAGFQDQCIQPLCHPSRFFENGISKSGTIGEARDSFNPVLSPSTSLCQTRESSWKTWPEMFSVEQMKLTNRAASSTVLKRPS